MENHPALPRNPAKNIKKETVRTFEEIVSFMQRSLFFTPNIESFISGMSFAAQLVIQANECEESQWPRAHF
jgi:hypothetical protein